MTHLPKSVLRGMRRTIEQRLTDERAILVVLITRPEITTAQTMLEESHFADVRHAELFAALVGCDSAMRPRKATDVTAILKRWQKYDGRLLRQVLGTDQRDVDIARFHLDWICQALRESADQAYEIRAAVATLERLSK